MEQSKECQAKARWHSHAIAKNRYRIPTRDLSRPPMQTIASGLFLVLVLLAASGCGSPTETQLADYLDALATASNGSWKLHRDTSLDTYPRHRQRRLPMSPMRMGLGDFFDLYGCRLFFLINQRNSVLGKVMPISQRLVYEIHFLQDARDCLKTLQNQDASGGNSAAVEKLKAIIALKRDQLPTVFWNATFDSPEMASAFSLAVAPLPPDNDHSFQASQRALEYFLSLKKQLDKPGSAVDSGVMESHYQTLQAEHYGGRLAVTLGMVTDYLNAGTTLLAASTTSCDQTSRQDEDWSKLAKRLAVVKNFLNQLDYQGRRWLETIHRLMELPRITPPAAFQAYRDNMLALNGGIWQRFQTSIARHREVQQGWLRACVPREHHPALRL